MEQIYEARTDLQILNEIADRFRRERLNANLTQGEIAKRSGLSLKTIQNIEQGRNTSLDSVVRFLRALGILYKLDAFLPDPGPSPIQLAAMHGHERKRATGNRVREAPDTREPWTW
jgi:transcriptional regulator with XRE-family HTH domain